MSMFSLIAKAKIRSNIIIPFWLWTNCKNTPMASFISKTTRWVNSCKWLIPWVTKAISLILNEWTRIWVKFFPNYFFSINKKNLTDFTSMSWALWPRFPKWNFWSCLAPRLRSKRINPMSMMKPTGKNWLIESFFRPITVWIKGLNPIKLITRNPWKYIGNVWISALQSSSMEKTLLNN